MKYSEKKQILNYINANIYDFLLFIIVLLQNFENMV